MTLLNIDVNALGAAGAAALRRGDAFAAQKNFEAIVYSGAPDVAACVGLALACQLLRDEPAMIAALDKALELDPYDLRALIMKADSLVKRDRRAAIAYYAEVMLLVPDPSRLPPDAALEVRRAYAEHARLSEEMFRHMQRHLAGVGYSESGSSERFSRSLSLLSGRTKRYEEEPRSYFMPDLPATAFYPREATPWLKVMEDAAADIRGELMGLLDDPANFPPFIEQERNRPAAYHSMMNNREWTACHVWKQGELAPGMAERCPRTVEALNEVPLERIAGKAPFAVFSRLQPGAWIRPHHGFVNTRLVCHLGLVTPPGPWLRVGAERRGWEEGKAFAFNDTIEHEVKNDSAEERIVLIFNVWRPEVTEEERRLVTALIESVNTI